MAGLVRLLIVSRRKRLAVTDRRVLTLEDIYDVLPSGLSCPIAVLNLR